MYFNLNSYLGRFIANVMTRNGGERWKRDYDKSTLNNGKNSNDSEDFRGGSMREIDIIFAICTFNNIICYVCNNTFNSILHYLCNNV